MTCGRTDSSFPHIHVGAIPGFDWQRRTIFGEFLLGNHGRFRGRGGFFVPHSLLSPHSFSPTIFWAIEDPLKTTS
jgi:hypothetical protein